MDSHKINYSSLNYLALIRFGHKIGRGWYSILVDAEMALRELGFSIEDIEKIEGVLSIHVQENLKGLSSQVQNILYEAELASEMTCEWCGNYSVSQVLIDQELSTVCEACEEYCESLAGVEKRLLMQKNHELEKKITRMQRVNERLEYQLHHYKMGCDHYKKRSGELSEKLKDNYQGPTIQVVNLDELNKEE